MGEMFKVACLIGWSSRDMWADSLCFLYVMPYLHSHTSPWPGTQLATHNDGFTFFFTVIFSLQDKGSKPVVIMR
jgi:hypothetical protein